jgi:rubrerythrin
MRDKEKVATGQTEILSGVKNIFEKLREEKDTEVNDTEIELYKKAQEVEKASRDFYLKQAEEVQDTARKEIFLKIADEENKHYFILERIIDFVSRPLTWLENPEWYHLEEY